MEAANRGASEAKGLNIGLNINLPMEQHCNPYISRELAFEFHYFFMRKFWFMFMAKALVIFPGGFGTMDKLSETMTLITTHKIKKKCRSCCSEHPIGTTSLTSTQWLNTAR
jgi:predicted Rossmann-fold nucleotide-binding protein